MKIQRWKEKDTIGLIILVIGLIGLILGTIYGVIQLLINPDISIIQKITFSGVLLFIAGIFILKVDD